MDEDDIFRRLRGALGNAVVWGVGWAALWVALVTVVFLLGLLGIGPAPSWLDALGAAVRFGAASGVIGFAAGGVFSGFFGFLYRGRRLSEISWVRVGIGGAVLAGLFVPLFLQAMNVLSGGGPVAWDLVLDDGLRMALFGGVAAGGSIKLAQVSDRLLPDGDSATEGRLADGVSGLDGRLPDGREGTPEPTSPRELPVSEAASGS